MSAILIQPETSVAWALVPAWVQALGSIGAIAASVWLVERQHQKQRRLSAEQAKQQYVARLTVIRTIADAAFTALTHIISEVTRSNIQISSDTQLAFVAASRKVIEHSREMAKLGDFSSIQHEGVVRQYAALALGWTTLEGALDKLERHARGAFPMGSSGQFLVDVLDAAELAQKAASAFSTEAANAVETQDLTRAR